MGQLIDDPRLAEREWGVQKPLIEYSNPLRIKPRKPPNRRNPAVCSHN